MLSVVDRAHDTLVGRYEVAEPFGVVVPADPCIPYDVFTMRAESPEVPDGALVRVRIAQFPTRRSAATGFVEEVLADTSDAPGAGIDLIVGRHKLETVFSEGALADAAAATLDAEGALARPATATCATASPSPSIRPTPKISTMRCPWIIWKGRGCGGSACTSPT